MGNDGFHKIFVLGWVSINISVIVLQIHYLSKSKVYEASLDIIGLYIVYLFVKEFW